MKRKQFKAVYILNELFQSIKGNLIVVLNLELVEQNRWGHHKSETFLATLTSRKTPLFRILKNQYEVKRVIDTYEVQILVFLGAVKE